ncbi:MAG: diguanylate cyclase [Desulfovibrionaceae bacterium]|nr:diguanylate cyclase [Desulfovibrionaceae bacterium]
MKHIVTFSILALLLFSSTKHGLAQNAVSPLASIKTYKDIPGVTAEEISAIEALKADRDKFSYGALFGTELFILTDGSYAGFTPKFCALLSELFGIAFVPEMHEWNELMARLKDHSLDFTGELTPTEERKRKFSMSLPIAKRSLRIFSHVDSERIQIESDIQGLKVGFLAGSTTADIIERAYRLSFYRVDVDNYHTAARMLKDGEIDAFIAEAVADPAFRDADVIRSTIFFSMAHESVAMTTANPALAPVISVVNKYIAAGGADKLYELYKEGDFEYAKYKLHRSFNSEERAFLHELKLQSAPIFVAFEHDNYPVSFYNEKEGEFQGIAVDVLAEISRLIGVHFAPVTTKDATWAEIYEKVKAGEIPMVAQLLPSEARTGQFLFSTVPYSRSYYAIMSKSDYPNLATHQVARTTVGMMRKSGHQDTYRELFPENDNIKEYDTLEESLDALERGEVDLVMGSEHLLLFETNYREKPGLKINIKLRAPMDSHFGFSKDQEILRSIIDKAQQYVQTDMIETSWTGRTFDYSKKLAEDRAASLTIFVGVLCVILLGVIFLFARTIVLDRKLKEVANKDALTNIFNRRYFMEFSPMQIERSLRTGGESFIIILDLDHFKAVNDTYGHLAGDEVLKEAAQRVKKAIRPYDLFGRYGGEEFIIHMSDINKADVLKATERVREEVCKAPVLFEGREIPISASFGIAFAAPLNDMHAAIKYSDEALYQAKESGRNRVVFFEEDGKADPGEKEA